MANLAQDPLTREVYLFLYLSRLDRRRRLRPVAVLCATLQRWWNSLQRRMAR